MTFSEEVAGFLLNGYILPARQRGLANVEVRAGEIHSKLGWTRRIPVVCAALNSKKLQDKLGLRLTEKKGPPSGQSPTVVFRYEILAEQLPQPTAEGNSRPQRGLLAARGAASHLYAQVGGGDVFLANLREGFGQVFSDAGSPSAGDVEKEHMGR
jgi:hypothetical protein